MLDDYLPVLEALEEQIEQLGSDALTRPDQNILNRIFALKRMTNQFWWVVWTQQDIINVLTNHGLVFVDEKSLYYLRNVSDHLARIMNSLRQFSTPFIGQATPLNINQRSLFRKGQLIRCLYDVIKR